MNGVVTRLDIVIVRTPDVCCVFSFGSRRMLVGDSGIQGLGTRMKRDDPYYPSSFRSVDLAMLVVMVIIVVGLGILFWRNL